MLRKCIAISGLVVIAVVGQAAAQTRDLTVEDIFSPEKSGRFRADLPEIRWLPDGSYLRIEKDRKAKRGIWCARWRPCASPTSG